MKPEEARELLAAENEDAITADGFETCLIGVCYQFGRPSVATYDYEKCIRVLMERDGMTYEDAVEFLDFNTINAWVGDNTPVFVKLFTNLS
jgi:hypothetical protein